MTDTALSPAAAMATQAVAVPPDSHAFVGRLPLSLSFDRLPLSLSLGRLPLSLSFDRLPFIFWWIANVLLVNNSHAVGNMPLS